MKMRGKLTLNENLGNPFQTTAMANDLGRTRGCKTKKKGPNFICSPAIEIQTPPTRHAEMDVSARLAMIIGYVLTAQQGINRPLSISSSVSDGNLCPRLRLHQPNQRNPRKNEIKSARHHYHNPTNA